MATAQSYTVNLPDVKVPSAVDDFDTSPNGVTTGKSIGAQLVRAFGGRDMAQEYQNLITENNRAYEQGIIREQRDYDEWLRQHNEAREDSVVQRKVADYKAAGLNPWLALQDGGIGGTSAQHQPSQVNYPGSGSSAKESSNGNSNKSSSLVMFLLATAKLFAAL